MTRAFDIESNKTHVGKYKIGAKPELLRDGSLLHFSVADARSADFNSFACAFHQCMDRLQIYVPATIRNIMGMADSMPKLGTTPADFTNFCHMNTPMPIQ